MLPIRSTAASFFLGLRALEDELVDWPELDLKRLGRRILRSSPSK
jgi:hypothetical protein